MYPSKTWLLFLMLLPFLFCGCGPSESDLLQIKIDSLSTLLHKKKDENFAKNGLIAKLTGQRETLFELTKSLGIKVDSIADTHPEACDYIKTYDKEPSLILKDFINTVQDSDRWEKLFNKGITFGYRFYGNNEQVIDSVRNQFHSLDGQRNRARALIADCDAKVAEFQRIVQLNNSQIETWQTEIDADQKEADQ